MGESMAAPVVAVLASRLSGLRIPPHQSGNVSFCRLAHEPLYTSHLPPHSRRLPSMSGGDMGVTFLPRSDVEGTLFCEAAGGAGVGWAGLGRRLDAVLRMGEQVFPEQGPLEHRPQQTQHVGSGLSGGLMAGVGLG